jgi:cholest-4-en-3-one 26-monooxygenase
MSPPFVLRGPDANALVDPAWQAAHGYPHEVWTELRATAPVARIEADGHVPFWAVTRHADVVHVAAHPARYSSAQGITLRPTNARIPPSEIVVMLDPPKHGKVRRVLSGRFTPRAVRTRADDLDRLARDVVDRTPEAAGDFDFVEQIAAPFPLAVIAWLLGVPDEDWELLFRWTNEIIGKDDPEFRRADETPGQTIKRARGEVHAYFSRLIEQRRRAPDDRLISTLLAGEIDGQPLNDAQLLAYCELLVEAGNETTRNAISGGIVAFTEHPDEWSRLRSSPELIDSAADEILRWSSPISHFARTVTERCEMHDVTLEPGDQVAIYFASSNRDESVFDRPFDFRIDRSPNPHLAFGFGEHVCMGAHIARLEIQAIVRHLLARYDGFELIGEVERLRSTVNGSIKRLPVRVRAHESTSDVAH